MKTVDILRLEEFKDGTFSALLIDRQSFCFTLEPPDRQNQTNKSNIPPGQYICKRYLSNRFGETFEVTGVPCRTNIIFHWGNMIEDTGGCILLGDSIGKVNGKKAVMNSVITFAAFMQAMEDTEEFLLTIREVY